MEHNTVSSTNAGVLTAENVHNHESARPTWQRPSISLLEVETATLTAGGAAVETAFSS